MKYLDIPFLHKEIVTKYGAKWDKNKKKWYCEDDNNLLCNTYDEIKIVGPLDSFSQFRDDIDIDNKKITTEYCYDVNKDKYLLSRGGNCNCLINNNEYTKEWIKRNPDKVYQYNHKYYLNNKEKIKEYHKIYDHIYYSNHIDKKKEYIKSYYQNNKEKMKKQIKESQERNKEKLREYQINYNKTDKRKEYKRNYYQKNKC